eukprot:TRINITY_DN26219_c0_g1_i1.p1 TRINITY_DN26219_c0_g1~~TRINITY_DN26219_c0_g1_i1.p1  ORF type:complete len:202 (-),score=45.45 TRINITY_DN26219_c0_g1_i1:50-655(-)
MIKRSTSHPLFIDHTSQDEGLALHNSGKALQAMSGEESSAMLSGSGRSFSYSGSGLTGDQYALGRRDSCDSVGTESAGSLQGTLQQELQKAGVVATKSLAATQRERTSKLRVADLAQHFHLPINLAAKELGICPTVLKKICRRNNMRRWPHRKIKSIERIIATLEQTLAEGVRSGDDAIRAEIVQLRREKEQLFAGNLGDL